MGREGPDVDRLGARRLRRREPRSVGRGAEGDGYPADRCFASVAQAAQETGATGALVVVPPHLHAVALEAYEAGPHVLVEKPLADTMANGREMVAQAEAAGRTLMVSQNYRYKAAPRAVARILAEPWLGAVTSATVEFRKAPQFSLPLVRHGYTHYKLIEDMSIHHFDLMRAVLADEPTAVYAQARNPEWSWFAAPPIVAAVIELQGGGLVQYHGSWVSRGRQTTWDGDWFIDCENGQVAGPTTASASGPRPSTTPSTSRASRSVTAGWSATWWRRPRKSAASRSRSSRAASTRAASPTPAAVTTCAASP